MERWERQSGESAEAYRAFCVYRDMGADRSIDAAHKSVTKERQKSNKRAPGHWTKWSTHHNWPERARAYDAHMAAIAQAERERVAAEEAAKWEKRRQELRESEWTDAQALRERATQMLANALESTDWKARDAAAYLDLAAKLERLAADVVGADQRQSESNVKAYIIVSPDDWDDEVHSAV